MPRAFAPPSSNNCRTATAADWVKTNHIKWWLSYIWQGESNWPSLSQHSVLPNDRLMASPLGFLDCGWALSQVTVFLFCLSCGNVSHFVNCLLEKGCVNQHHPHEGPLSHFLLTLCWIMQTFPPISLFQCGPIGHVLLTLAPNSYILQKSRPNEMILRSACFCRHCFVGCGVLDREEVISTLEPIFSASQEVWKCIKYIPYTRSQPQLIPHC